MNPRLQLSLAILLDTLAVCIAWVGSYLIRFNFEWPADYTGQIQLGLGLFLLTHILAGLHFGLYRGMLAFASLPDVKRMLKAVLVTTTVMVLFMATYRVQPGTPRSVMLLFPLLLMLIMGGGRLAWRMWSEHRLYSPSRHSGKPVVIAGAGRGGAMLLRELDRSPDWNVVALVDDDPAKHGLEMFGRPVAGSINDLPDILQAFEAHHVILAMPSAARDSLQRATTLAAASGAHVFTVPSLEDLMTGRVGIQSMRPVAIEDLLGREPVSIDTPHVQKMLAGKTVLVTGAGGSIGSELCRQLRRFSPEQIILYELGEFALYTLEQWFATHSPETRIIPLAGDVKDDRRLEEVFSRYRPQVIFHAAAYKHVPLMEVDNAWQAVRNNVLGTLRVAQAAQAFGAERFILISTDKAVNPTNVMGATKRLAEMVCEALYRESGSTQFEMVRFGNVLGSNGSVIPKFQEQIARGGPLTVTHPEITRYFMSIPEAAQLVLQAAAMGEGGEIFVLDMGEPVRIIDMARNMIRLCGYTEDDIRIEFTGLRPGEKLYEELLADSESTRQTPHPKLRIAQSRPVDHNFLNKLALWLNQTIPVSDEETRAGLIAWVPEYTPAMHDISAKTTPKGLPQEPSKAAPTELQT